MSYVQQVGNEDARRERKSPLSVFIQRASDAANYADRIAALNSPRHGAHQIQIRLRSSGTTQAPSTGRWT